MPLGSDSRDNLVAAIFSRPKGLVPMGGNGDRAQLQPSAPAYEHLRYSASPSRAASLRRGTVTGNGGAQA
jgi:hypothetical protein